MYFVCVHCHDVVFFCPRTSPFFGKVMLPSDIWENFFLCWDIIWHHVKLFDISRFCSWSICAMSRAFCIYVLYTYIHMNMQPIYIFMYWVLIVGTRVRHFRNCFSFIGWRVLQVVQWKPWHKYVFSSFMCSACFCSLLWVHEEAFAFLCRLLGLIYIHACLLAWRHEVKRNTYGGRFVSQLEHVWFSWPSSVLGGRT